MHKDDHARLDVHTILFVESIHYKDNVVNAVIQTSHFGRPTTKPWSFSYDRWHEVIEQGYI